jgi:peptidyl-prolyl cis-trans isomerase SurA
MELEDISEPILYQTREGREGYRLIRLLKRIEPHRANLTDDYQILQDAATNKAKQEITQKWIVEKINRTYINIDESFHNCKFEYDWIKNKE